LHAAPLLGINEVNQVVRVELVQILDPGLLRLIFFLLGRRPLFFTLCIIKLLDSLQRLFVLIIVFASFTLLFPFRRRFHFFARDAIDELLLLFTLLE